MELSTMEQRGWVIKIISEDTKVGTKAMPSPSQKL
jgi:hypothetical protein